jgi:copper chaperone CopZ
MTSSRLTLWTLAFFMLLAVSCGGGKNQKAPEVTVPTATIDLSIEGMTCTGCENTISSNLEKLPGIKSVTASHTKGNAIIEYEPDKVDTLRIKETVDGLGYKAVKVSLPESSDTE